MLSHSLHLLLQVKEYCINRGFSWVGTVANTVMSEHDYYDELIKFYRANKRVSLGVLA